MEKTLVLAARAYAALNKPLPFDTISVNPKTSARSGSRVLDVYIVKDAASSAVSKSGCSTVAVQAGDELDEISVRGGCIVVAVDRLELRCSAEAVQLFGHMRERGNQLHPALLYMLAHELGHIHQNRLGEYAGRVESLDLSKPQSEKVERLRAACDPSDVRIEAQADAMSVEVLKLLLPKPPYREPAFSEQGSVLWAVDQLNLAANSWQKLALEREFISQPKPHPAFIPTVFPTPPIEIAASAKKFVCEVLSQRRGTVQYPLRAIDHPPLEQRMRVVAEALIPIAANLAKSDGAQQFQSIAVLQEQLSPIFSHIYRETGVYLESVRKHICSRVNSETPAAGCR
ncbi:MAG: hypothetical protein KIT63_02510 [Rhodoferax sp.]|nr:hypothetical protein [Rhodoferax sp.]